MDRGTEQKTWQVYNFGKRNVFRLDLNESREGFCWRGRGRSFHVDGLKTEMVQEPTVESLVRGYTDISYDNTHAYTYRTHKHTCDTYTAHATTNIKHKTK